MKIITSIKDLKHHGIDPCIAYFNFDSYHPVSQVRLVKALNDYKSEITVVTYSTYIIELANFLKIPVECDGEIVTDFNVLYEFFNKSFDMIDDLIMRNWGKEDVT